MLRQNYTGYSCLNDAEPAKTCAIDFHDLTPAELSSYFSIIDNEFSTSPLFEPLLRTSALDAAICNPSLKSESLKKAAETARCNRRQNWVHTPS